MTELNQALGMKEQIISLLESGCKVKVRKIGGDNIYVIYAYDSGSGKFTTKFGNQSIMDRGNSLEVLEVIPPTIPEYKEGDEVMVRRDKWEGPYTVMSYDRYFNGYYVEGGNLDLGDRLAVYDYIVKYHEGVQYNPLPTTPSNEPKESCDHLGAK